MQDSGDCHVLFVFFIRVRFRRSIAHGQLAIRRALGGRIGNAGPHGANDRHYDHGVAHRVTQGIPQCRPGRHILPLRAKAHQDRADYGDDDLYPKRGVLQAYFPVNVFQHMYSSNF